MKQRIIQCLLLQWLMSRKSSNEGEVRVGWSHLRVFHGGVRFEAILKSMIPFGEAMEGKCGDTPSRGDWTEDNLFGRQ